MSKPLSDEALAALAEDMTVNMATFHLKDTRTRELITLFRRTLATVEARDNLLRGLGKAGLQALSELSAYTTEHHRDLLQRLARIHEVGVEIALREEGERDV